MASSSHVTRVGIHMKIELNSPKGTRCMDIYTEIAINQAEVTFEIKEIIMEFTDSHTLRMLKWVKPWSRHF